MNTKELKKAVQKLHPKITKLVIDQIVTDTINTMRRGIVGGKLSLSGIGTYTIRHQKARTNGRNPKTGEKISVPAKNKVWFSSHMRLKAAVNEVK